MRTRRHFSEDFKRALVNQIVSGALSVGAALEKHKLVPSVLARWRKDIGNDKPGAVVLSSKLQKLSKRTREAKTAALSQEQRDTLKARLLKGDRPVDISRDFNIDPSSVYYYKKLLRMNGAKFPPRGEIVVAEPARSAQLPPGVQLRDAITVANSIERDIMNEYTSGKVKELSARDIKTLMLRKMLRGEM